MRQLASVAALTALATLLIACGTPPAASPAETIAPNANLVAQGIPPIPARIAEQVAKYTDFRGHAFVDWHPTRREMLVSHLRAGASTPQLFRIASPLAEPEQLTDTPDPVRNASYEPRDGRYIVFARGSGGNEQFKPYRLDLPGRQITLLTVAPERHTMEGWLHASALMLTMSTPLDRTAAGGSRAAISQTLRLMDPLQPQAAVALAELPGGGWGVGGIAWDDKHVALTRYLSANESQVWLLELASRRLTQLLPAAGSAEKASWLAGEFKRDDSGLFLLSDQGSEFRELVVYSFAERRITPVTHDIPWNISGATGDDAGTLIAAQANVDGRDELRIFDAPSLRQLAVPNVPPGSVGTTNFHPKLPDLASSLNSAQRPSQIWSMNSTSGAVEGRMNYYVNELGIAVIQPNVRGSSGYGKTFLALDDGFKREDSVKDIGALLDWITTQPGLDASRVVVSGGSYGGYMSLAVAATFSDRIAGAIDVVGSSSFLTFLRNTESYRRDLRRVEDGDERDPAMRAHLEKISPLTSAGNIRKPRFVVQGKNDPRVPVTEAEQVVAKVRANGSPVWYLRGENEGHGFAHRENAEFQFYATVLFLQQTLGLQ